MLPDTTAAVPLGYRRLLGGDIVPEAVAEQVLPSPRLPRPATPAVDEQPEPTPEASPTPCGCPRDELGLLRATLAVEREARIRAEAHGAGVAEGFRLALAQVLEARPPVPLAVPIAVPPSPGDASPFVPPYVPPAPEGQTAGCPPGDRGRQGGEGGISNSSVES